MADYLGIDYGESKTGLAIADAETKIASPLKVIFEKNFEKLIDALKAVIREQEIKTVVVGLPMSQGGVPTAQTKIVQKFVERLQASLPASLSIKLEDERFSTRMGKKLLEEINSGPGRFGPEDAVTAAIILQGFLDRAKLAAPKS